MPKSDRWIEKNQALLKRPRKCRLVTELDLQDEKFRKKYPHAQIGQQLFDEKPLFWGVGLKRKPTLEQKHAQIAAQVAYDLRQEMDTDQDEDLLDDNFSDDPMLSSYEAAGALYDGIPDEIARSKSEITEPTTPIVEDDPSSSPESPQEKTEGK